MINVEMLSTGDEVLHLSLIHIFRREPLAQVFADWYQQPVFAGLSTAQREALVALRSHNCGTSLAAVSYTHLDVYKRQVSTFLATASKIAIFGVVMRLFLYMPVGNSEAVRVVPVSYTHLRCV